MRALQQSSPTCDKALVGLIGISGKASMPAPLDPDPDRRRAPEHRRIMRALCINAELKSDQGSNTALPRRGAAAESAGALGRWKRGMQGLNLYLCGAVEVLGVDSFGAPAPAKVMLREFGLTVANAVSRSRHLINMLRAISNWPGLSKMAAKNAT